MSKDLNVGNLAPGYADIRKYLRLKSGLLEGRGSRYLFPFLPVTSSLASYLRIVGTVPVSGDLLGGIGFWLVPRISL